MSSAGAWQPSPCHNTHLQRAQWGLGVTACRHATLPNGSSCTLVPFPLCKRAFPDGTSPPSTFPSDRNAPSPPLQPGSELRFWPLTSTNKWQLALFDQPKWEHMWQAAPFFLSVSRCGMWCQLRIFFCRNNSFQSAWKRTSESFCLQEVQLEAFALVLNGLLNMRLDWQGDGLLCKLDCFYCLFMQPAHLLKLRGQGSPLNS